VSAFFNPLSQEIWPFEKMQSFLCRTISWMPAAIFPQKKINFAEIHSNAAIIAQGYNWR
jgi:hypothetical protein